MPTLILKIPMDEDWCVCDKGDVLKALQVLVAYSHWVDIPNWELIALMEQATQSMAWPTGPVYEIVED